MGKHKGKGLGFESDFDWEESLAGSIAVVPRCYESHPALKVGEHVIYGGSASWPIVKDADIYVSLQSGSTCSKVKDPWDTNGVIEVQYSIGDHNVPTNVPRFLKMIDWLCNQLQQGKKIHVGCIGGHGRTGMVLAAIVAKVIGEKDAIQYVRKHYCHKAVEADSQVSFLGKNFGCTHCAGSKPIQYVEDKKNPFVLTRYKGGEVYRPELWRNTKTPVRMTPTEDGVQQIVSMPSNRCIWSRAKNSVQ